VSTMPFTKHIYVEGTGKYGAGRFFLFDSTKGQRCDSTFLPHFSNSFNGDVAQGGDTFFVRGGMQSPLDWIVLIKNAHGFWIVLCCDAKHTGADASDVVATGMQIWEGVERTLTALKHININVSEVHAVVVPNHKHHDAVHRAGRRNFSKFVGTPVSSCVCLCLFHT
jgi:hypothetical protein